MYPLNAQGFCKSLLYARFCSVEPIDTLVFCIILLSLYNRNVFYPVIYFIFNYLFYIWFECMWERMDCYVKIWENCSIYLECFVIHDILEAKLCCHIVLSGQVWNHCEQKFKKKSKKCFRFCFIYREKETLYGGVFVCVCVCMCALHLWIVLFLFGSPSE